MLRLCEYGDIWMSEKHIVQYLIATDLLLVNFSNTWTNIWQTEWYWKFHYFDRPHVKHFEGQFIYFYFFRVQSVHAQWLYQFVKKKLFVVYWMFGRVQVIYERHRNNQYANSFDREKTQFQFEIDSFNHTKPKMLLLNVVNYAFSLPPIQHNTPVWHKNVAEIM